MLAPNVGGGFDPSLFQELADVEGTSFWFAARNRIVLWALSTWFGSARSFLEVGCGTGYVLQAVAEALPELNLFAVDLHVEGLEFARRRVPSAVFAQADARALPFHAQFDVAGAFDVIEHVENDAAVLSSLRESVRPGGGVIVTVPQHPFLWSAFDDASHHVRRYRRHELEGKMRTAGLEVVVSTSFISLLLPAMAIARLAPHPGTAASIRGELEHPRLVERALDAASQAEFALLKRGLHFPFGGSRLVVARRAA
jgi:SAM-dependent methyltransferase